MFARLLLESLRRGRRRKLVAAAAVAAGTAAASALGALILASGDALAAELTAYGANLEVVPADEMGLDALGLSAIRRIFWRNNILGVAPRYPLRVRWGEGGPVAPLIGTWFAHSLEPGWETGLPATRPTLAVAGRWPREGEPEVVLGRRLAERLDAAAGETVEASVGGRRARLAVVGIAVGGGEEEEQGFAPLAIVQGLAGRPGRALAAEVRALTVPETDFRRRDPERMSAAEYDAWYCTAYPSSVAFQIEQALPGSEVRVVRRVAAAGGALLVRLREALLALAATVLAGAGLAVAATASAGALERRGEIGLLAALGADSQRIARFFLAEAAILGLAGGIGGGLAGLAAGRAVAVGVFGVGAPWAWSLLPMAVGGGVLIALVGSLPAIARTLRSDPGADLRRAPA